MEPARAAENLFASSHVGKAQIATLMRCSDVPLFGTQLKEVHAILGGLAKPPLQLAQLCQHLTQHLWLGSRRCSIC